MSVRAAGRRRTVREDGPEPVDVHVGKRLRLARQIAGISQTELAAGIGGVSFQAVQKYETGENRISASRLYMAARIVGRPVSFFFDDMGTVPAARAGGDFSDDEIALIRSYRLLADDALRHSIAELAKRIGADAEAKAQRR